MWNEIWCYCTVTCNSVWQRNSWFKMTHTVSLDNYADVNSSGFTLTVWRAEAVILDDHEVAHSFGISLSHSDFSSSLHPHQAAQSDESTTARIPSHTLHPQTCLRDKWFASSRSLRIFLQHPKNHNGTNVTRTRWYCALPLCLLSRNILAMILCFLCAHECICVPLWARTCTGTPTCSPLIRLMSWTCVWAGTLGVLLPGIHQRWRSPSHWYSELLHVEFVSIICIPGSYVCGSRWCLWLTGSAAWVLKL